MEVSRCSGCGHEAGKGHGEDCQHGMRPKFIHYKGQLWSVDYKSVAPMVKLWIVGFANKHCLTWGIKAFEGALCDGTFTTSLEYVKVV